MKKILSIIACLALLLTGCNKPKESSSTTPSVEPSTEPSISVEPSVEPSPSQSTDLVIVSVTYEGVTNETINQGSAFRLKEGIVVRGTTEDSVSIVLTTYVKVKVNGVDVSGNNLDTTAVGTYTLEYYLDESSLVGFTFADNLTTTASRTVEVIAVQVSDEELVLNGDFSSGMDNWGTFVDGSQVNFEVVDGAMKVTETTISPNSYSPRLNTDTTGGMEFVYGTKYRVQFMARAEVARSIVVQVGQILNGAPYWVSFPDGVLDAGGVDSGVYHIIDLTTEMKLHSFEFNMLGTSNSSGHITFEMGTINSNSSISAVTTIYLDDISIKAVVGADDEVPPTFSGVNSAAVKFDATSNATFDVLAGVTATDTVDGDVTSSITYTIKKGTETVDSIPLNTKADYVVTYKVSDAAGNEVSVDRTVRVKDLLAVGTNVATVDTTNNETLVFGGESDVLNTPNKFNYWYIQDAGWGGGNPVNVSFAYVNGDLVITQTSFNENRVFWNTQLFYATDITDAGIYKINFDVTCQVSRSLQINGTIYEFVAGVTRSISIEVTLDNEGQVVLSMQAGTGLEDGAPKLAQITDTGTITIANFEIIYQGTEK